MKAEQWIVIGVVLLFFVAVDSAISTVVVRAAVAAFNATWKIFVGDAAPPASGGELSGGKRRKKTPKSKAAVPEPDVGQAIRASLFGILGTVVVGLLLRDQSPRLLLAVGFAARCLFQGTALVFVLPTTPFRAAGVTLFDGLVRGLIVGIALFVGTMVLQH